MVISPGVVVEVAGMVVVVERAAGEPPPQAEIEMLTRTRTAPRPTYRRIAPPLTRKCYGSHRADD
jgi:hypothetical protein